LGDVPSQVFAVILCPRWKENWYIKVLKFVEGDQLVLSTQLAPKMMFKAYFFVLPALVNVAVAICPGFNFGIGNVQSLGSGINRCKSP